MEFDGSEATILIEVKQKSIFLKKIHKSHIARHHSSIFICVTLCQMFMVQAHWCTNTYIVRFSLITY